MTVGAVSKLPREGGVGQGGRVDGCAMSYKGQGGRVDGCAMSYKGQGGRVDGCAMSYKGQGRGGEERLRG